MSFNEECIFENISLVVINMNNGINKVVNMKIHFYLYVCTNYLIINVIVINFYYYFIICKKYITRKIIYIYNVHAA